MIWELQTYLRQALDFVVHEASRREWTHWVFCFAPLMVFLEIPRYYLSFLGLWIAHLFGYPRLDRFAVDQLLERAPLVSVVVAGRNESATIVACIRSLLDQNYPNYEIIIIDDNSDDNMSDVVRRYARQGKVRLVLNKMMVGRGGRPSASNIGLRLARGEFVVSVDADCSFDRNLIRNIIAPFSKPEVAVVAGNIHVRNPDDGLVCQLQTLEYIMSIDLRKRWTTLLGCTLQASGALGAFRTEALRAIHGWDPDLAEDADLSMRMRKAGYKSWFAADAVLLTEAPPSLRTLMRQRGRWDRGGIRNYFFKHYRCFRPGVVDFMFATEIWAEFFFNVVATAAYPLYIAWMLWYAPGTLLFALVMTSILNTILSVGTLFFVSQICTRVEEPMKLLRAAFLIPTYKSLFRWVRFRALVEELLRVKYEDGYLPRTAWREMPRF